MSICKITVSDFLPKRVALHLEFEGIHTLYDLVHTTEDRLLSIKGFDQKRLDIVKNLMAEFNRGLEEQRIGEQ